MPEIHKFECDTCKAETKSITEWWSLKGPIRYPYTVTVCFCSEDCLRLWLDKRTGSCSVSMERACQRIVK